MAERITAVKKSSLAGLAEGWGDECFAIVRPAQYTDMIALDSLDASDKVATAQYQIKFVRDRFIAGKIKVWTPDGQELVDMTVDDVECSTEVLDKLYADIMGFADPKALREVVAHEMQRKASEPSTEMSSSEETSKTSTSQSPAS